MKLNKVFGFMSLYSYYLIYGYDMSMYDVYDILD